ncbi:helix-turn-helix domain-containing protein [Nocardioides marmoraquaticus]
MGSTTAGPSAGSMLFRAALGEVLRASRMRRGMTLRQLSAAALVSLGYISEIERGQKEASSELLAALCEALDVPLSEVLRLVSDQVEVAEITSRVSEQVGRATTPGADVVAAA